MENDPSPFPSVNTSFEPKQAAGDGNPFFDLGFGVVLPLVGLIIDPVLFRNWLFCGPESIATPYANFAYGAIGLCMLTLLLWIVSGGKLKWGLGWMAGILLTGGFLAMTGAILMMPAIMQALPLFCMGLIGLFPFITGFVYFKNGNRVLRHYLRQNPRHSTARMMVSLFAGVLLVTLVGVVAQNYLPDPSQSFAKPTTQLLCRSSSNE